MGGLMEDLVVLLMENVDLGRTGQAATKLQVDEIGLH